MDLKKLLKKEINDLLIFSDKIVEEANLNKKKVNDLTNNIIEKSGDIESCKDDIDEQRKLVMRSFLAEQDLIKSLSQLNSMYKVSVLSGLDLELEDGDKKRLDFTLQNDKFTYKLDKGGLLFDKEELISQRIDSVSSFPYEKYVESLKVKNSGSK